MPRLCKEGHVMRDLGQWPKHNTNQVENKFHCLTCNIFEAEDVSGLKLIDNDDGTRQVITV